MAMTHTLFFLTIYWNYKQPSIMVQISFFFQLYSLKTINVLKACDHFVFPITYLKKVLH